MKIKALFLLVVFLLNTVVGLVCAIHLGPSVDSSEIVGHDHGSHTHGKEHAHPADKATISLVKQASLQNLPAKEQACCKDDVNAFSSLAKNITSFGNLDLKAPVYFVLPPFFSPFLKVVGEKSKITIFETCRKIPPSVDIRVSISSFLI